MKRNEYQIDLLSNGINGLSVNYQIDDKFFHDIDGLIQRGKVDTVLSVETVSRYMFHFYFRSKGVIYAPCDRCLADISVMVDTDDMLTVKLGTDFSDDGDVIVIPEQEGVIDVSQYIYEFLALSLPMKLVHKDGECDEQMVLTLHQHMSHLSEDDE